MNEREQDPMTANNSDTTTATNETPISNMETTPTEPVEAEATYDSAVSTTSNPSKFNVKAYIAVVLAILLIGAGLIFVLEKEGRISTGLFSGVISDMEAKKPVATVNDVAILKKDFDSSVDQLLDIQAAQGVPVNDPTVIAQVEQQAVDTLVNAELLRQAAIEAGVEVTTEQIDTRYNEISEGLGGAELLAERMAEFNVTEESLRRDIENEFLIQGLFAIKIPAEDVVVTDEEVSQYYEQVKQQMAGSDTELPPLQDVSEQIVQQLTLTKEQELITEYIDTLKAEAEVEILL